MTPETFDERLSHEIAEFVTTNNEAFRTRDDRLAESNVSEFKQSLRQLFLETIGGDKDPDTSGRGFKTGYVTRENKYRAELRSIINGNAREES